MLISRHGKETIHAAYCHFTQSQVAQPCCDPSSRGLIQPAGTWRLLPGGDFCTKVYQPNSYNVSKFGLISDLCISLDTVPVPDRFAKPYLRLGFRRTKPFKFAYL